jgi:CubicO group peptidase (beta-lactamase class C family)
LHDFIAKKDAFMNHSLITRSLCLCCYLGCLWFSSYQLVLAQPPAAGNTPAPQNLDELQVAVEKIRTDTQTPAIGIALVNRDGPQWIAGLGLASLEQQTPADENTLFRIGSISKMFVGLAVLKLVEEGRLNLNDKLSDLAPDIPFENPWEETHPIRLVHLLEHTTGWDDMSLAEYAYPASDTMSLKAGLDYRPASRTSRWVPGTRMAYCNTGPAVAAYIVEKITGKTFEEYIQAIAFDPLQMDSTSFYFSETYAKRGASLYSNGQLQDYWNIITRPAGSINSSATDMANFLQLLIARGEFEGQQIIQPASLSRMEIPQTTTGSAKGISAGYGLHNYTSGYKNFQVAFHGHNGGMPGALAELAYAPELNAGFVIMINSSNHQTLTQLSELLRGFLLKGLTPSGASPTPLPESFTHVAGYYLPINYRSEFARMFSDVQSVMRFRVSDFYVHRFPLLGGWEGESNDYALNNDVLIDRWTGLPTIAWVEDPLAGQVIQVGSDVFKPISAARAYGVLAINILVLLVSVLSVLCVLVWAPRRWYKKLPLDESVWVRVLPLFASVCLVVVIAVPTLGGSIITLGRMSIISVTIMLGSILYALVTLGSLWVLWRSYGQVASRWIYGYACLHTGLHLYLLGQLAVYGLIGIRTWV